MQRWIIGLRRIAVEVDGLPEAAVGPLTRAEQRSLERSLERLRRGAEGRRVGPLRRSRDGVESAQPL